jgi:hypothetical protein
MSLNVSRATLEQCVADLYFCYWYFVNSCNQIRILHWKWVPMYVAVLAVPINTNSKTTVYQIYPTVTQDFWPVCKFINKGASFSHDKKMYKQQAWVKGLCWNIELATVEILETCLSFEYQQLLCVDLSGRALHISETVTRQKLCLLCWTWPKNFIWIRGESFSPECQSYVKTGVF